MSLWQYFATRIGKRATFKWTQYFPIYEKYFSECVKLQSYGTFVRIGDQSDYKFLQSIVDSKPNIQGEHCNDIPILSPEVLQKNSDENMHVIISAKNYAYEIKEALENKGFKESVDFSYYSDYL